MPKIKYLRAYQGIQPGTVVNEHREDVVERLTKVEFVADEKGIRKEIVPIAKLCPNEPTTQEREMAAKKAENDAKNKAAKAPA